MLFAWVVVGAHLSIAHGGELFGSHFDVASHEGHHHDQPADGHHHHDLGAATSAQFAKSGEQPLFVPRWTALCGLPAATPREMDAAREWSPMGISPPDERASGWLLDCHTALPVRGPSLA